VWEGGDLCLLWDLAISLGSVWRADAVRKEADELSGCTGINGPGSET